MKRGSQAAPFEARVASTRARPGRRGGALKAGLSGPATPHLNEGLWQTPSLRWKQVAPGVRVGPVPRISKRFLNCAIYLYDSVGAAREGEPCGGSGFLVNTRVKQQMDHIYAVTCGHVAIAAPVVRLGAGANSLVLDLSSEDWVLPGQDDLAVCRLDCDPGILRSMDAIHVNSMIAKNPMGTNRESLPWRHLWDELLGAEVMMVGRFVGHDGKQRNAPSLRFGNVAMLPEEPIEHGWGFGQESFLVEMRSLPGYSGSPVFLPRGADQMIEDYARSATEASHGMRPQPRVDRGSEPNRARLLGVDWCHLNRFNEIFQADRNTRIEEGWWAKANSGMAGVVPSWRLYEFLFRDDLVEQRERIEAAAKGSSDVSLD